MNIRTYMKLTLAAAVLALIAGALTGWARAEGPSYGVYEYVVMNAEGTVDGIAGELAEAAGGAGWEVLAVVEPGRPGDCRFRAKVLVLFDGEFAAAMLEANGETGAYGALDRVAVFEDENGTHVSIVNPNSITRTVLMDDESFLPVSDAHRKALRSMILSSVDGTESEEQYGQMRTEGLIGKTMGVVAGGEFKDLIKVKAEEKEATVREVASDAARGMSEEGGRWGMKLAYEVEIPGSDVIILGSTGTPMDSKSFEIVSSGGVEARKDFDCPGLSHAAAYPLELVVRRDGDKVRVEMIDAMFRMKMYFEDAGKIAFMKNMKMPGSIDKELSKQIRKGLK